MFDEEVNEESDVDMETENGENELQDNQSDTELLTWGPVRGNLNYIPFNPNNLDVGVNPDIIQTMADCSPYEFYKLFFDNDVLDFLIEETNRYASQLLVNRSVKTFSRIKKWYPVDRTEMNNFLGIVMWMGLVQMPSLSDYWKKNVLYQNYVTNIMSRNQFELILCMFHCSNNESPEHGKLSKIQNLIDLLVFNFQKCYIPEENVCIDESMVPFIGRLSFRQYLKNKTHKYGIKIFKLCAKDYYTLQYNIYAGKNEVRETNVSYKIVLKLMEPYINLGRCLYIDNWYSSVELAEKLIKENTHMVGTLRANRRGNPLDVIGKKLKKGELIAQQSNSNIVVLKWRDKRDIYIITTKHTDETVEISNRYGSIIKKPKAVEDYNMGKSYIDRSDQMASYSSPLKRSLKGYRKIALYILLSTSVVNALSLFKSVTKNNVKITFFKEEIIKSLLHKPEIPKTIPLKANHNLVTSENGKKRMCQKCYATISTTLGRKAAQNKTRKVLTCCDKCNIYIYVETVL